MTHKKEVSAHKNCVKSHKEKSHFQNKKVIFWWCYHAQNQGYDAQILGYDAQILGYDAQKIGQCAQKSGK